MNKELISALRTENWAEIRRIAFALPEQEKAQIKKQTQHKDWENIFEKKHLSYEIRYVITYLMMCVCHSVEELLSVEKQLDFTSIKSYHTRIKYPLFFLNSQHSQAFMDFIHTPEGAYMIKGAQQVFEQSPRSFSIEILLALYTEGIIPFNEEIFVKNLYDIEYSRTQEAKAAEVLLQYPELATCVIPHTATYIDYVISSSLEWQKVFTLLCKKNYFPDKSFITSFIEVLLKPWKKNVLDMYCRWIEGLTPTEEELLPSQHTLFALLTLDKSSLINFAMKCIAQISTHLDFDFQTFADNFALCFTVSKIAKSQLIGIEILEKYYKKQAPTNPDYREQLAVLFTVPYVKLQEKVANLLTTYFNHKGLPEVIAPYRDYLKGKAQDLLATLSQSESSTLSDRSASSDNSKNSYTPTPKTAYVARTLRPEDLLFLLGDCLRERTAATIDLFFEGLVQLQDQLPENFKEQLAPYIAQVNGMYYFNVQLAALQLLLAGWVENRPLESPEEWRKMHNQVGRLNTEEEEPFKQACVLHNVWYLRDEIPYLLYKVRATLSKLKSGSKLPFLSTPTHAPFYIDAETLADRLLAYQTAGKEVDLDDLVVACNRLLLSTITPKAHEKVRSLSGQYASALGYLFGLSDVVTPTEELLPLWTQITRLKHPDKVFTEFEATAAKDYLSAVKPFFLSYEIDSELKWFYLEKKYINSPYNDYQRGTFEKEEDRLPYNYYNAGAFQIFDVDTLRYTISLNPQYVDVLLGKYTPPWVGVSDAETYRNLQVPLQLLLEYDLPVHHGGWIFVGMALLHDKKETRDLAAEYILRAISRDENLSYLQHFLADILAQKLTPINRFVEFLDMPTRDPKIKAFQKGVVEAYLPLAEKQEKKPTNHKKLANWLM